MEDLRCVLCRVWCDNAANYAAHVASRRHLSRINMGNAADYYCRPCGRQIDSRANYEAHCASRAHIGNCARAGVQPAPPPARPVVQVHCDVDLDNWDNVPDDVIIGQPVVVPPVTPPVPRAPVVASYRQAVALQPVAADVPPTSVVVRPIPTVVVRPPPPVVFRVPPVDVRAPEVVRAIPPVVVPAGIPRCVRQHVALQPVANDTALVVAPVVCQPRFADVVRGPPAPVPCAIRQPVHRADIVEPDPTSPATAAASLKRSWANVVAADLRPIVRPSNPIRMAARGLLGSPPRRHIASPRTTRTVWPPFVPSELMVRTVWPPFVPSELMVVTPTPRLVEYSESSQEIQVPDEPSLNNEQPVSPIAAASEEVQGNVVPDESSRAIEQPVNLIAAAPVVHGDGTMETEVRDEPASPRADQPNLVTEAVEQEGQMEHEPVSPAAAEVQAPSRVEEWRCHQCDGLFAANSAYRRHRINCHPDSMPEIDDLCLDFNCNSDDCTMEPVETAVNGVYRSITLVPSERCITADQLLLLSSDGIRRILSHCLVRGEKIKAYAACKVTVHKINFSTGEVEKEDVIYISNRAVPIQSQAEFIEFIDNIGTKLDADLDKYTSRGSNWIISSIDNISIRLVR